MADAAVAIRGDTILTVGPNLALDARYEARRRLDATGRYVFQGLINTHTHLYQTFMKGLGEGLPLYGWIDVVTAPSTVAMKATPVFDPIASLVYSAGAGSVDTVVVAGQVLLDEGRITAVDEPAVLVQCQAASWQLARRVGTKSV